MSGQSSMNTPSGSAPSDEELAARGAKKGGRTGWIAAAGVLVVLVAVLGVGFTQGWFVPPKTSTQSSIWNECKSSVTFTGAGSSFVYPLMSSWTSAANLQSNSNCQISYTSIGSGAGITQLTQKLVNFGATDAPLNPSQKALLTGSYFTIPEALGAVAVIFNVPGVKVLNLTGDVVAGIYLGKIASWNDTAIKSLNPRTTLPNLAITVVHRLDGSGTTFVFTNWLKQDNTSWATKVGAGLSVLWPVGLAEKGSTIVTSTVVSTSGAIGYAELNYAKLEGAAYAAIRNPVGNFITPNATNTAQAAQAVASSLPSGSGDWTNVSIINQPGAQTYPLATLSYVIVYQDLGTAYGSGFSKTQAQWEVHFLWWAVTEGQKYSAGDFYVPLPSEVTTLDEQTIAGIHYNGQALTTP
jgi:phosphate transport system substrate-binding protein